ncbi:histidine--tRNA ligase [Hydromonas duriensis]|uniref:Histidine--tRNA ligase n=1 Tax=Hydromonas duriensis TaxID=1527608 RepID=A0A4R6Y803_9BURK|nr:histidine--tRNA ligase [Hydromonas duriensis]TDR31505.1 histidyl-tRNA synthetase [Hydromonas duriensis]
MSKQKFQAVKGMNDILPEEAALWEYLEDVLRGWLRSYGYRNMRAPVLEQTALFRRGIGEATDVVEKEMFSFVDRLNGDELTMRPEFTAGVVRATVEHSLTYNGPQRVYSMGPVFRHERPQKGRYRQFHQLSVEALGFAGADMDAELIVMLRDLWDELGLTDVRLELNTLGMAEERAAHRLALIAYFEQNESLLDDDGKRRLHTNPLRILDTKNPAMQDLVNAAPRLDAFLGEASRAHFDKVQRLLSDVGIAFTVNPRLVRGLDYYNHTVFEWISTGLGSQGTICGGGRYDGMIELFGGKPTPAVGFGLGLERLLLLTQDDLKLNVDTSCDVYVVHQGEAAARAAFSTASQLRQMGLSVVLHCGGVEGSGSFKSQMKKADMANAMYAVIIGDDELAAGTLSIKPLRDNGEQVTVATNEAASYLMQKIAGA